MRILAILLLAATAAAAQFTQPLATGVRLDPAGEFVDLGNMPIGMALAPDGAHLAVVLSGFREQGLQIVDLKTRQVTQTLKQEAAFYGAAFSPDATHLYVSGGNDDTVFCYRWSNGTATLERKIVLGKQKADKTGSRYPAGIAVSKNGRYLYVAENVGDALAVVDLQSENIDRLATDHYPYAVEVAGDGNVYVSAWGADTVSVFGTRANGTLFHRARIAVGRRPSALASDRAGKRVYAALGGSDDIAVIDTAKRRVTKTLRDPAPGAPSEGSTPNALALSPDGATLFVAEGDNNAVALFDTATGTLKGRIPTDWYPTALLTTSSELLVLNGKGHGSHANPGGPTPGKGIERPLEYDLGQLNGTLRITKAKENAASLAAYSRRVAAANNWTVKRSTQAYPPFKHVVYIVKENRTYDQLFGDLKEGDGDPSLVFFDHRSTPNHRALALRFGLFDRFFTNAEVSAQGHIWSTAAYVTDYSEKVVPSMYADKRADTAGDDDAVPEMGWLWTLAKKAGVSFRDYGQLILNPQGGPETPDISAVCLKYPAADFKIRDQKRADAWIDELKEFSADGNMPQFELVYLPNDHTAGGRAGMGTPTAYMADNDLALGRMVEALSHSPYWKDTVMFVLEDDSQAGPDHVDAHRGPLLVISAYNRPGTIHRFANTTDVLGAIEDILKMGRLSKYDYFSRSFADVFASTPDLSPYSAITPEASLDEKNPEKTKASELSKHLDLSAPDRIDDALFNQILWAMLKPDQAMPKTESKAEVHLMEIAR
ncbi:MAG TPA: bifunctional YncE family protein/alkaline phosphatase family protein [Thermoanaerobaculia bacterium]|jgi:YVTN family beta-propeller protein|nr:bifunctional YncE family protein/alkaline phosphatase family protein [Thermoanaerobaculia bacterium]